MNDTLAAAQRWLDRGINCIPCYPGTKHLVRGTRLSDYDTLRDFPRALEVFRKNVNIAVYPALSPVTQKYLVVLDFDNMSDYLQWRNKIKIKTLQIDTRRGYHIYFWCKQSPVESGSETCEVKYRKPVMIPPSVVNGYRYRDNEQEIATIESIQDVAPLRPPSKEKNSTDSVSIASSFTRRSAEGASITTRIKLDFSITILFPDYISTGNGMALAHCPGKVHKNGDVHPSLSLDLKTNRANCFKVGCEFRSRRGNSNIDCWMILNNVSFKTAIKQMARQLGL